MRALRLDPKAMSLVAVFAGIAGVTSCGEEEADSMFGANADADASVNAEAGKANTSSSSGEPCVPVETQSAAAPAVPLCGDAGAVEAGGVDAGCEDDLATCQRICSDLLPGYDYCGVDDGTDGGRVVRCTIAGKPCDR